MGGNQTPEDIETFFDTIATNDVAAIRALIEQGADVKAKNVHGETPLTQAASLGNLEAVRLLLDYGAGENEEFSLNDTAVGGNIDIVHLFMDLGADVNRVDDYHHGTPLMTAASEGYVDIVRFLIESGANVNYTSPEDWTALKAATENGHADVVELLKQAGASR